MGLLGRVPLGLSHVLSPQEPAQLWPRGAGSFMPHHHPHQGRAHHWGIQAAKSRIMSSKHSDTIVALPPVGRAVG